MTAGALVLLSLLATATVAADDAAVVCQATIESGGRRLLELATDAVDACAHRKGRDVSLCVSHLLKRANRPVRRRWAGKMKRRCASVEVTHDLGYLDICVSPGESSACSFTISGVVVPGKNNDLLDCLACQIDDRVLQLGRVFLPTLGVLGDACQLATTASGLATLHGFVAELAACLERPEALSIARCLADDARRSRLDAALSDLRTAVTAGCAGTDPFGTSGYPVLCARFPPTVPPRCSERARVCDFPVVRDLDVAGDENDLLDCFSCQVEEAAVGFARDLYGSNLCCTGTGCPALRTRAACRRAGGRPVHYRVDPVDDSVSIGGAHGVAVAADGSLLFATTARALTLLPPGGAPLVLPAEIDGFPSGVALDAAGNAFVAVREANQISRTTADGLASIFAGTGMVGHAGDGGPATAAVTAAPDGVAVDADGNVFFTESGAIALLYGTGGGGEYVRMVDPLGVIHSIAGIGAFGTTGANGPATAAALSAPYSLALADDGTLLIGEAGAQRVLRLDRATGILHHVAGRVSGFVSPFRGDDGPALAAEFSGIEGIGQDGDGKIFVADFRNQRVRMIDRDGAVATVAGTGYPGAASIGPGVLVSGGCPAGLAVGRDGRIYFADIIADRMRMLTAVDF